MIYLILAILTSTLILVTFKLMPRYDVHLPQAITINYLTASVLGYLSIAGEFSFVTIPLKPWFPFSMLVGLSFILGFFVFGLSTKKVGIALTSVASKMSVVIPVMLGFIIFNDKVTISRIAGVFIALLAFYLSLYRDEKLSPVKAVYLFPILLFLANGLNDSFIKMAQAWVTGNDFVLFLATVFAGALIFGLVFSLVPGKQSERLAIRNIVVGVILGLLNWYSTLAVVKGLGIFDVSVFFPAYNAGVVGLSSALGAMFFKEKLSILNWLGITLALVAILVIALN